MKQKDLFLAFFRVGMLGYGGGPSSIPLVYKEVVENHKWMSADEFSDTLAIGNTLPGPIATKMAGYIGYREAGVLGMLNAVAATVLPTVGLMIILLASLATVRHYPWVEGMTRGVLPVVAVLLGVLTKNFVIRAVRDLGEVPMVVLLVGSYLLIQIIGIHPALVIFALIIFAVIKPSSGEDPSGEGGGRS